MSRGKVLLSVYGCITNETLNNMHHKPFKQQFSRLKRDGFFMVAFWQLLSFVMMILLIWVNEVMDLSALWFGIRAENPNFFRGCALTIGVIIIAIITVGHTYLQQKRILKGLIVVCSKCRKMRVDKKAWAPLDQYLHEHALARVSHGLCPDCYERAKQEVYDFVQDASKPHQGQPAKVCDGG